MMSMNPHNWSHLVFFAVHLAGSNVPIFNALYGLYHMTFDRSECSFEPFFKGTFSPRSQTLPQQELPYYNFLSQHGKALRQRRCTSRNYVAHSQRRERFECKALRLSTSTGPRICHLQASLYIAVQLATRAQTCGSVEPLGGLFLKGGWIICMFFCCFSKEKQRTLLTLLHLHLCEVLWLMKLPATFLQPRT